MKTKTQLRQFDLLINGKINPTIKGEVFEAINPSNGEVFARVADGDFKDINFAIMAARTAFDSGIWSGLTFSERGKYLIKIAEAIRDNAKELAELESLDIGKTNKQTTFIDVPTCADTFEYFGKIQNIKTEKDNPVSNPVKSKTY